MIYFYKKHLFYVWEHNKIPKQAYAYRISHCQLPVSPSVCLSVGLSVFTNLQNYEFFSFFLWKHNIKFWNIAKKNVIFPIQVFSGQHSIRGCVRPSIGPSVCRSITSFLAGRNRRQTIYTADSALFVHIFQFSTYPSAPLSICLPLQKNCCSCFYPRLATCHWKRKWWFNSFFFCFF